MAQPVEGKGKRISRSAILGAAFVLVLAALMIYASASLSRHSCEICIDYHGREACRKADGSTLDEARRTAIDLACAVLASGMTESLQCQRTEPKSLACDGTAYAGGSR